MLLFFWQVWLTTFRRYKGAGVASGLTFWLLFVIFVFIVLRLEPFRQYHVLGWVKPKYQWLKDYLRIGVPMGFAIFMEAKYFWCRSFIYC